MQTQRCERKILYLIIITIITIITMITIITIITIIIIDVLYVFDLLLIPLNLCSKQYRAAIIRPLAP